MIRLPAAWLDARVTRCTGCGTWVLPPHLMTVQHVCPYEKEIIMLTNLFRPTMGDTGESEEVTEIEVLPPLEAPAPSEPAPLVEPVPAGV